MEDIKVYGYKEKADMAREELVDLLVERDIGIDEVLQELKTGNELMLIASNDNRTKLMVQGAINIISLIEQYLKQRKK